jgi:hypothetical protein
MVPKIPNIDMADSARIGCGLLPSGRAIINGQIDEPELRKPCEGQDQVWLSGLLNFKPDVVVFSYGAWELYDQNIDNRTLKMFSPEYRSVMLRQLQVDLDFVAHYAHARVAVLDVPCFEESNPRLGGPESDRNNPKNGAWVQGVLNEFAQRNPQRVAQVALTPFLCPGGKFRTKIGKVTLRPDGVHYSSPGAKLTWRDTLGPQLVRIARKKSLP